MKVIDVSCESTELRAILAEAREKNIILRTEDGLAFMLAEIDEFDVEIALTRKNSELMEFLEQRAGRTKTVSAAEARKRLGLVDEYS